MKHNNYKYIINASGCWIWKGPKHTEGYGQLTVNKKRIPAHKYYYEQKYGPVPEGLVLDHFICNTKICCNPDHVRPETDIKNRNRWKEELTHCPHGHEYTPENTYKYKGNKQCLTCRRKSNRVYWLIRKKGETK